MPENWIVGLPPTPFSSYLMWGRIESSVCCSASDEGSATGVSFALQEPVAPPDLTGLPASSPTHKWTGDAANAPLAINSNMPIATHAAAPVRRRDLSTVISSPPVVE